MDKCSVCDNVKCELYNFTGNLIPISNFSRGKTSKIFDDVKNNNAEYIVLKNNKPSAVILSISRYTELINKAMEYDKISAEVK